MKKTKTILNGIMEDYCLLPAAKILREMGFDVPCRSHYEVALTSRKDRQDGYTGSFGWKKGETNVMTDYNTNSMLRNSYDDKNWYACSRPTNTVAVEWVYLNQGIWLTAQLNHRNKFYWCIDGVGDTSHEFSAPHEAIDDGLQYVLENKVKKTR